MVYFNKELCAKALMELHDQQDVVNDYIRIFSIFNSIWTPQVLKDAYYLDTELREKYKTINLLFHRAYEKSHKSGSLGGLTYNNPPEIEALIHDYFGIAADVLLKKSIIKSVEEFIDSVD